jgi:hypothetical protein
MGDGISILTPSECERSKLFDGLSFLHDMVLLATMALDFILLADYLHMEMTFSKFSSLSANVVFHFLALEHHPSW